MVQIDAELTHRRMASRMLLQVHDELIFEAPAEELKTLSDMVRQRMEGAIALTVPLTVTIKTGPNWLELTEVKGR